MAGREESHFPSASNSEEFSSTNLGGIMFQSLGKHPVSVDTDGHMEAKGDSGGAMRQSEVDLCEGQQSQNCL